MASTACSACRRPRRRAGFTPRRPRWWSCRKPKRSMSPSIRSGSRSTSTVPADTAGKASIPQTRRCASPTPPRTAGPPTRAPSPSSAPTGAALAKADIPSRWLDAEILVAHVIASSRERLHSHPERLLSSPQRARLRRLTSRRVARVPVPYLVGEREFYGHMLRVTPAVLIPRPSSELLVELAIAWLKAHPERRRVSQPGTGSAALP